MCQVSREFLFFIVFNETLGAEGAKAIGLQCAAFRQCLLQHRKGDPLGPGLGVGKGLAYAGESARDGGLVGHFGVLARAAATQVDDVLAHGPEEQGADVEVGLVAAHRDREGACLAAVLVVSAAAAVFLLAPKDVANRRSDPNLADAFESESAVVVDNTIESEGYRFNLAGLVSGSGLSKFAAEVDESRTYAVMSVARTDGTPIEEATTSLAISPLVSGPLFLVRRGWEYHPTAENANRIYACQAIGVMM